MPKRFEREHPSPCAAGLTRRGLFRWTLGALAANAFVRRVAADTADGVSPVMAGLSAYMADARNRALPQNVQEEAKHHSLDTVAARVSGSQ